MHTKATALLKAMLACKSAQDQQLLSIDCPLMCSLQMDDITVTQQSAVMLGSLTTFGGKFNRYVFQVLQVLIL